MSSARRSPRSLRWMISKLARRGISAWIEADGDLPVIRVNGPPDSAGAGCSPAFDPG